MGYKRWTKSAETLKPDPRFDSILTQVAYPRLDQHAVETDSPFGAFEDHEIHSVLAACARLRPAIDIAVSLE